MLSSLHARCLSELSLAHWAQVIFGGITLSLTQPGKPTLNLLQILLATMSPGVSWVLRELEPVALCKVTAEQLKLCC